jgi:hypothetical protein
VPEGRSAHTHPDPSRRPRSAIHRRGKSRFLSISVPGSTHPDALYLSPPKLLENGGHMQDLSGDVPGSVFKVPSGECSFKPDGLAATDPWDISVLCHPKRPYFGVGQDLHQANFGDSKRQRGLVVGFWACTFLRYILPEGSSPSCAICSCLRLYGTIFGHPRVPPSVSWTSLWSPGISDAQ